MWSTVYDACKVLPNLHNHPVMLQGYQLGSSQLDFAIQIQVTSTTNASSATTVTETLQLDPSDPYVLDSANLVTAQLLGDLLTYTALPVFTDTYLMIPSPTGELQLQPVAETTHYAKLLVAKASGYLLLVITPTNIATAVKTVSKKDLDAAF